MLQEDNEIILDKVSNSSAEHNWLNFGLVLCHSTLMPELPIQLRCAEERREEAEARARELEKQVINKKFSYLIMLKLV